MSRLSARSEWLLRYAVGRLPHGFCTTTRLEGSPDGLDMMNVRGLQKRGWLREDEHSIFYATEAGTEAVKHLGKEKEEREEEKAEELAEKMMGGCGHPWCRGTTGKAKEYCPECRRQKEEERRRAERVGEQIANKG